jgi:hypothetical protein
LNIKGKKRFGTLEKSSMAQPSRSKEEITKEKQSLVFASKSMKKKKRRLFEDEITTHVSGTNGASRSMRQTTRSMAKKMVTPYIPYFPEEPVDIPDSPEVGGGYIETISETEELVTETLKDLLVKCQARREDKEKVVIKKELKNEASGFNILKPGN